VINESDLSLFLPFNHF